MHKSAETILVGDVGGTNVRLGLAHRAANGKICVEHIRKLPNDDYNNFAAAISDYQADLKTMPRRAAFALAGAVDEGRVTLTNRNWTISEKNLQEKFGFTHISLYNDFAAMARSVPECAPDDFKMLNPGTSDFDAPILVAGPGTGFGMAVLLPLENNWHVLSGEGGHQAYAPQSSKETEILHILQKDHDFVSLELVRSGSGLDAIHKAVCMRLGQAYKKCSPKRIRELALTGDAASLDVCTIRANAIMGALGDMALAAGARGGVVLAGGVAKRLQDFIDTPDAMARYFNRGPRRAYVENIPVRILQKPAAALYGVAALNMDTNDG